MKLKGLNEYIEKENAKILLALKVEGQIERWIKWVPPPDCMPEPEVRFQNVTNRPVSITLSEWTYEAACMWIYELAEFLQEEPKHEKDKTYFIFEYWHFDVDLLSLQGCYWKKTGVVRHSEYEETILVCS